jgi:SAM-dependent methyltransferase
VTLLRQSSYAEVEPPDASVTSAPIVSAKALSTLCALSAWEDPSFRKLAAEIMNPASDPNDPRAVPKHRKLWEFARATQALEHAGLLHDGSFGLSIAGGAERIAFYLANRIQRMVVTDIYGHGAFAAVEAQGDFLHSPERYAPYPYRHDHLKPLFMDALALRFPDHLFDFAVSFSSVEHFGGVKGALRAIREMGRVVRPGGLVIVTTDCSVNTFAIEEVFSRRQIQRIVRQSGLELVTPLRHSSDYQRDSIRAIDMHRDDLNALPHIYLRRYFAVFTSVALILRVPQAPNARARHVRPSLNDFDTLMSKLATDPVPALTTLPRRSLSARLQHKILGQCWKFLEAFR